MNPIGWILFLGGAVIAYISRKSLRHVSAHGFYRFFAWETLWAMFLLNAGGWFQNPLAWYQLVSWILLITSLILLIQSLRLLQQIGKPGREDPSLLGLEKTTRLVTVGLYRYIRHPLYSSLLFLGWGMAFKSPSWLDAALVLACTAFLFATARAEERENETYFGDEYSDYMKHTRRFVPYLF